MRERNRTRTRSTAVVALIGLALAEPGAIWAADTRRPTTPTNLKATAVSPSRIDLTWTASTDNVGVSQYQVQRCTGATCSGFAQISSTTGTSYSNTGLAAGTTYRYRVRALDAAGNRSAFSAIASAMTLTPTADTVPPSVSVSTNQGGPFAPPQTGTQTVTITATASDNPGGTGVTKVEFYDGANLTGTDTTAPYSYSWTFSSANAGHHNWSAKAYDAAGNVGTSQVLTLAVLAPVPNFSINSTSQDSNGQVTAKVAEQSKMAGGNATGATYTVLAVNDLGMHCGDLDTRISSILPPFQAMLAQVIQKGTGSKPTLNPAGVDLYYSAASNPKDPILANPTLDGMKADGSTYKTNFWSSPLANGAYDPFYPAADPFNGTPITPLVLGPDTGLPVPNVWDLYFGPNGIFGDGDEFLLPEGVVVHSMPGQAKPYSVTLGNAPQKVEEHYIDKPFFANPNFKFGYLADKVNWYEGAGIPFSAFDDFGREAPYPMVRVQAKNASGATLATVDTVLPISGEASCSNCHSDPSDIQNSRSSAPTAALQAAKLPVATSMDDPDTTMPQRVSVEYAADINILRLHDLKHGARYVSTACDNKPAGENCLNTAPAPCTINQANPNGNANCLTNKALVPDAQGDTHPVVCQVCHYTPALDLAHLGPLAGPPGTTANGRNQLAQKSNSNVMHSHHGNLDSTGKSPGDDGYNAGTNGGNLLFPLIPAPEQNPTTGAIDNQGDVNTPGTRLAALEDSCYQCHPGKNVKCLRGAMFNGGMLCSDCHGTMDQVGNDFSNGVKPETPGAFQLAKDFYTNPLTPRVPWANEPGCGSCHTGNATYNLFTSAGTVSATAKTNLIVNTKDQMGFTDEMRLRALPASLPANLKAIWFAEPLIPASVSTAAGTTFTNPGAGNPKLYRVSTGHGGVMCEGCHGATHAEWPNANPASNDNIEATQNQGHAGFIMECTTCHTTSAFTSAQYQGGPHGMHLVNDSRWNGEGGHGQAAHSQNSRTDRGTCGACHGADHKGTVLSRATADRSWTVEGTVRSVRKGQPVPCDLCHSLSKSFGT